MGVTVKDDVWRKLLARAHGLEKAHARVGVLAAKGGGASRGTFTMVQLAATHEFGSPAAGIPERSFIRRTFREKQAELATLAGQLAKKVVTDGMEPKRALGLLGAWGSAQVKNTITEGDGIPPPNAPSTIARKGSDRPLVDTGRLVGAITWVVSEDEGEGI